MKGMINKIRVNIFLYVTIFIILFVISKLVLNLLNIEYRNLIYIAFGIIVGIFILLGLIQTIYKLNDKKIKILYSILLAVAVIFIVPTAYVIYALTSSPEHVVVKDNKKLVGYVCGFLRTHVEYYDYINFIVRGKNIRLYEDYGEGIFDPIDNKLGYQYKIESYQYYDYNGNMIASDKKETYTRDNEKRRNIEDKPINEELYVHYTSSAKGHKVSIVGYAMGKYLIIIYKTEDGGKTWEKVTKEDCISVYYDSKFKFIDETVGFLYDPGRSGTDSYAVLKITKDGGVTWDTITLQKPDTIEERDLLLIYDLPEKKDNKFILTVYTLNYSKEQVKTYYQYVSEDNGETWNFNGRIENNATNIIKNITLLDLDMI